MKYGLYSTLTICLLAARMAIAQTPFTEGTIVYDVMIDNPVADGGGSFSGTYTITVKGREMKKTLKMNNGYEDVLIFNANNGTIYSLKATPGKKYAIQLSKEDFENRVNRYSDFTLENEEATQTIAGLTAQKATVAYSNGEKTAIYYTKEWVPANQFMLERFPGIKYLPLSFVYDNANGAKTHFKAVKVQAGPIENAIFRIPADYKIISYKEYQQLNQ